MSIIASVMLGVFTNPQPTVSGRTVQKNNSFQLQKISAGEIQKNNQRIVFLAGRALLSPRAQIRFELGHKTPPNQDKIAQTGARASVLFGKLRFCGAKPICFSGGENCGSACQGTPFVFVAFGESAI